MAFMENMTESRRKKELEFARKVAGHGLDTYRMHIDRGNEYWQFRTRDGKVFYYCNLHDEALDIIDDSKK